MKTKVKMSLGRGCPAGKIMRRAYTRKDGTRVRPGCVPDKGSPGRTPAVKKWARFGPGSVPSGWKKAASPSTRHQAIRKDVAKEGGRCLSTFRKLLQVANVTTDRPTEKIARTDYRWLTKQPWCRLKKKPK